MPYQVVKYSIWAAHFSTQHERKQSRARFNATQVPVFCSGHHSQFSVSDKAYKNPFIQTLWIQSQSAVRRVKMCSLRHLLFVVCVALALPLISGYVRKPGPRFVPTVGYPWPMPRNWKRNDSVYSLKKGEFSFRVVDKSCEILESAINRYKTILHRTKRPREQWRRNNRRRDQEESIPIEVCINGHFYHCLS